MYNIILADPAWPYAKRSGNNSTKFGRGVHGQYETMTEDQIKRMAPYIDSLAADNCALLMWTTGPRMDMAMRVLEAWKFRYCTQAFVWVKAAKSLKLPEDFIVKVGKQKMIIPAGTRIPFTPLGERACLALNMIAGPGNYSASNAEFVVLGMRGSMKPERRLVPEMIVHSRMAHSKKPPETRDRIVQMFGELPRIELFARDAAPGWDANGLELDGTDYTQLLAA